MESSYSNKKEFWDMIKGTSWLDNPPETFEELTQLLGRARAKLGMFEGDLIEGELEIGQVSGSITEILPASKILNEIWNEFNIVIKNLASL